MGFAGGLAAKLLSASAEYDMLREGDKVLIALSGGADSTALAVLLNELSERLGISLHAAHLNHCLRGEESDRDETHVRNFCERFGIPLTVERIDVAKAAAESGDGIEETARRIRYEFLERTADSFGCTKIATAHNLNDNAETVIMNLIRGTGLRGLAGIPPVRGRIVRPLLFCPREAIEGFLKERGIDFVTDHTNFDKKYIRNKIRHEILPLLCDINPLFIDSTAEFTKLLRSDADYLDGVAESIPIDENGEVSISRDLLAGLPAGIAGRIVKRLYAEAYRRGHGDRSLVYADSGSDTSADTGKVILSESTGRTDHLAAESTGRTIPLADEPTKRTVPLAGALAETVPDLSMKHILAVMELAAGGSASGEVHLPGGIVAYCRYEQLLLTERNPGAGKKLTYGRKNRTEVVMEKPLELGETRFGSWVITAEIVDKICYIKTDSEADDYKACDNTADNNRAGDTVSTDNNIYGPYSLDIYNRDMSNIINVAYLDPQLIETGLTIRGSQTGDSISPVGRNWTKTLKKLYIEMKVPRQERALRPVIAARSGVCAIPGYKADKKFAASSPPALKVTFRPVKGDGARDRPR